MDLFNLNTRGFVVAILFYGSILLRFYAAIVIGISAAILNSFLIVVFLSSLVISGGAGFSARIRSRVCNALLLIISQHQETPPNNFEYKMSDQKTLQLKNLF